MFLGIGRVKIEKKNSFNFVLSKLWNLFYFIGPNARIGIFIDKLNRSFAEKSIMIRYKSIINQL